MARLSALVLAAVLVGPGAHLARGRAGWILAAGLLVPYAAAAQLIGTPKLPARAPVVPEASSASIQGSGTLQLSAAAGTCNGQWSVA